MSLKFGQIRLLVSMVTDWVMMGKTGFFTFSRLFFIRSFSYLQVTMTCMRAQTSSIFGLIGPPTTELAALGRINLYWGRNGVAAFSQLFLIKPFSYLQVIMTYIGAWMSSKFDQIRSGTTELAALEHLKIRSCPFSPFTVVVTPEQEISLKKDHPTLLNRIECCNMSLQKEFSILSQ